MNYRQANTICRNLCKEYGIRKPPHIVPLKDPWFPKDKIYNRHSSNVALGYNDQFHNTVGLNRLVMIRWQDPKIIELIMHELAHKVCYQRYRDYKGEHGEIFESVCRDLGFPDHIAKDRM